MTPQPRQHYGLTLAVLAVSALAYALSQTLVAPALPAIQHDLDTSTTAVTWVLTVYLLSASVATPIVGRLGDMFGKEHVLVFVLIAFAAGSLVGALSHSIALLVLGRAIQGVGGGVFPLAFGIIRDEFPRERVAAGIGLISATFGIGGGVGLVLSGVIVDNFDYQAIFWLGFLVTAVAVVATKLYVPESPVKAPARIDWPGAAMLSGGLICLLVAVSQGNVWGWSSPRIVGLFAAAAVTLAVWVRFETRVLEPLVDMRMMRLRPVWTTNTTGLLIGFGMFGSFILIPQLVEEPVRSGYGFGATVTGAGIFMLPSAGAMLFSGPVAGAAASRFGSRLPLLAGTLITAASFGLLAVAHDQRWHIYLAGALLGVGVGSSYAAMANLIVDAVPQSQTGVATGMNTIMRTIGGSLGAQISASIVAGPVLASTNLPAESGFTHAFVLSAVALLIAFAAALAIPRPPRRADAASVETVVPEAVAAGR